MIIKALLIKLFGKKRKPRIEIYEPYSDRSMGSPLRESFKCKACNRRRIMGNDFCEHHSGMLRSRAQAEAPVYPKLSEVFGGSRSGESLDTSRMDETLKRLSDIARRGGSLTASVDPGSPEGDTYYTTEGPMIRIDELGSRNSDRHTWATQTPDGHTIYFQGRVCHSDEPQRILDGLRSPQLLLQEQCRSCRYRNRDFDGMVEREHLKDLKCGVNPSYAESGVGECEDFEMEGDRPS